MYKNLRVTIVIPCLNEEEGIQRVLNEVPTFVDEIVVVDNGSTDGSADYIRSQFPWVRLVVLGENRGFAGEISRPGYSAGCRREKL